MLTKRVRKTIKKDLDNGNDIYLKLNSGRYEGSILLLEKIKKYYWWQYDNTAQQRFLMNGPGLVRRISMDPENLSITDECKTYLTNTPNITKKQKLPKDFVDTPIDIDDYLYGNGSLIQITSVSTHNHMEARCIASINDDIKVDGIKIYRSLKKFLKIDDPELLLRMQNDNK